jgi:DNA-binding beta-propeller fold protein YncE
MIRIRYALLIAAALAALFVFSVSCSRQQQAQTSGNASQSVLSDAHVMDRLTQRTSPQISAGATAPSFVVDAGWPKPLPHNWRLGQIGGIFVDHNDHIWVIHRPRSLTNDEAGALGVSGKDANGNPIDALGRPRPYGRYSACCVPAPSVLEFDKQGNLLQAWGGPSDPGFLESKCRQQDGCFWPGREHGIYVDQNNFVYIAGNGTNFHGQFPWAATFGNDSQVLKFTQDGKFVLQIGAAGAKGPNSDDTHGGINGTPEPFLPADMTVDPKTNHLYIADGYGNRRVLIVDAATGKYIGHFGAYGQNPVDPPGTAIHGTAYDSGSWVEDFHKGDMKPGVFRSPVHCVKLTDDGLLYTCDRGNNRIQIFKASEVGKPCANPSGEVGKCGFVGEVPIAPQTNSPTSGSLAFSSDPGQSCLYVADLANAFIYELNRKNLQELGRIGREGRQIGEFHWLHVMSVDSDGNIYTGEVDNGSRIQKLLRYGATGCSGTGSEKVGEYRQ